jgi:hypothetical protein
MLTDQAYRNYARPAKDEHRRVHRRLPIALRPSFLEEEASRHDKK